MLKKKNQINKYTNKINCCRECEQFGGKRHFKKKNRQPHISHPASGIFHY